MKQQSQEINSNRKCCLFSQRLGSSSGHDNWRTKPNKQQIRSRARALVLALLVAMCGVFHVVSKMLNYHTHDERIAPVYKNRMSKLVSSSLQVRELEGSGDTFVVLVTVGVVYMFIAISIVCDEFFVPALEEIASEKHLNLSMDVAGATLMAAGGSAPELFTSLIGTFSRSEIGLGTIVGSAVFNVLFVIGMCAICTQTMLQLTWWPLFRDCTYYAITLGLLALFCGYISPNEIEMWESLIMFAFYIGYVTFMKFNEGIYDKISRRLQRTKIDNEACVVVKNGSGNWKPNTFRAGLLNFLMGKGSLVDKVGFAIVTKISGDVNAVFRKVDMSGDGYIDHDEFKEMIEMLDAKVSEEDINRALDDLDDNRDGKIDLNEFTKWYITSESRLKAELRSTFDEFDIDQSGTIDIDEMRKLMKELGAEATEQDIRATFEEAHLAGSTDQISYEEFESWYTHSKYWDEKVALVDNCAKEVIEPISGYLKPPKEGKILEYCFWLILLPVVSLLCFTIPDVRQPGKKKLCFVSFFLSIFWIGIFTFFMVDGAEYIGHVLGIPVVIMGLTIVAAGTSVPDLLTSVIVSRMGEGDMAVSSSVGSNIFDVTVGLPIPWILFHIVHPGEKILVETKGMTRSILLLLVMLLCIVILIHFSSWKLTKTLGFTMFALYFAFLVQAILLEN